MLITAIQKYTNSFGCSILELDPETYAAVSKACYYPGYSPLNPDNFDLKIKHSASEFDAHRITCLIHISNWQFESEETVYHSGNSAQLVKMISSEPLPEIIN
jgi:hypothetical protein